MTTKRDDLEDDYTTDLMFQEAERLAEETPGMAVSTICDKLRADFPDATEGMLMSVLRDWMADNPGLWADDESMSETMIAALNGSI